MIRVLLVASVTYRAAGTETWVELGIGGCRAAGGVYDKRRTDKALDAVGCRKACEEDEACTAIVFGSKGLRTICHLLGGGPYTHADGRSNFTCSSRTLKCIMPEERDGYDLSACNLQSQSAENPHCPVGCSPGYTGLPVVRCLSAGGIFSLDGCEELSPEWALHGAGSCSSLGGPYPFVSISAVSRTACQASCQDDARCQAITYDADSTRCELALETPPALHEGSVIDPQPECWRLGPPSLPKGESYDPHGIGVSDRNGQVDSEADNPDAVVSVVVILCILLLTASLAVTHMLRVRLLERVSDGQKVHPPSLLARFLCGPCAMYYWEGNNVSLSRYATSWCCWRPSSYVVQGTMPTVRAPGRSRTPIEAFSASPEKANPRVKHGSGSVSPERPCSKGSSCSTRASSPSLGSNPSPMRIGRETHPGSPSSDRCSNPSARGQVRGEPPPLPPLTRLPIPQ